MTKREAKRLACAILSVEGLSSIVDAQCDANQHLNGIGAEARDKIVAAAEEIADEMFRRAGKEAVDRVTKGARP